MEEQKGENDFQLLKEEENETNESSKIQNDNKIETPEKNINFLNQIFFCWVDSM
jgi:hypothetical protein